MKWITKFIDYFRQRQLAAEESMNLVREDYEKRNRATESWMTIHDREYLALQKENK